MVQILHLGVFISAIFALGKCKFCKPGANFASARCNFSHLVSAVFCTLNI